MPLSVEELNFIQGMKAIAADIHDNAEKKGFWFTDPPNIAEKLMLIVSEISEALEEHRGDNHGVPLHEYFKDNSGKLEGFSVELADAVIRIIDLAYHLGIPLAEVILAKHKFNVTRPYKHGKSY